MWCPSSRRAGFWVPGQEVSEEGTAGAAHGMEEWDWVAPLLSEGLPERVRQDPGW